MIRVKAGQAITGIFVRMMPVIVGKTTSTYVQIVKTALRRFSKIVNTQGIPGLVKYLKACSVSTQQSIAGYKTVTSPRISRTNSGLPRILPVKLRRMIQSGNPGGIKMSLTLFSLYRDFIYDSEVKTSSITGPFTGKKDAVQNLKQYVKDFDRLFVHKNRDSWVTLRDSLVGKFKYFPITTSSPFNLKSVDRIQSTSTNPIVMIRSALGLEPNIVRALQILSELYRPSPTW